MCKMRGMDDLNDLIQRHRLTINPVGNEWSATIDTGRAERLDWGDEEVPVLVIAFGPTPLEAVLRCIEKSQPSPVGAKMAER